MPPRPINKLINPKPPRGINKSIIIFVFECLNKILKKNNLLIFY
jgi:hypothetical protein